MVYVSTQVLSAAPRGAVMQAQSALTIAQQELASGKYADVGLTLGGQSGQLVSLSQQSSRLESYTVSNSAANTRLTSTTSAIDTLTTAANSVISALTTWNASSPSQNALGLTAQSSLGALTSILNTSVAGQYIFGGINTDQQPVTTYASTPASAAKTAVDNSFATQFGFSQTSASAGSVSGTDMQSYLDNQFAALFSASSFSSTWSAASDQTMSTQISDNQTVSTSVSANQTAFRQLAQAYTMLSEFTGQGLSAAAQQAVVTTATNLVGQALSGMTDINAGIGITQSTISDANTRLTTQKGLLDTQVETLQGVDSYALTSQLSTLQTQIQSSYELTAALQKLSLVNYITP